MMLFCSEKLQNALGCRCEKAAVPQDPLDGWFADRITLYGKDTVVAVLPKLHFCAILYDIQPDGWTNLNQLLVQAIRQSLYYPFYGLPRSLINQYLPEDAVLARYAAEDQASIAVLNDIAAHVLRSAEAYSKGCYIDTKGFEDPAAIQAHINKDEYLPEGAEDPVEVWSTVIPMLQERYGTAVPAMELELNLRLGGPRVSRTLIFAADSTFTYLFRYVQSAFFWEHGTQHQFLLLKPGDDIAIADADRLIDHLREGDRLQLTYCPDGIGIPWEIDIDVNRYIPATEDILPICTDCSGKAPPELVGGPAGYKVFLQDIMNKDLSAYDKWQSRHVSIEKWTMEDSVQRVTKELGSCRAKFYLFNFDIGY